MSSAYIVTDNSVTVIHNGKPLTMNNSHSNYDTVIERINADDFDGIEDLFDVGGAIINYSEGNIQITDNQILYKGIPVDNYVVDKVFAFMKANMPYKPLLKFVDKLMANSSRRSVQELYKFLEHKSMPITPDGNFLAYKSVRSDWTDHHTGKFSNTIGSVLEMQRNQVCDDANVGCSYGFHAGSLEYAKGFGSAGSRLLIVEIDPSDVVSVPHDCNCQKLRTTKYKVVAEFERPLDELVNDDYGTYPDEYECDGDYCDDEDCECRSSDYATDNYEVGYDEGYRAALRQKAAAQKRDAKGKFIKLG